MRKISILGSTGSIGTQTLDVIRKYKDIEVVALSADKSVGPITEQIKEFKPRLVCMYSYDAALKLKETIKALGLHTEVVTGIQGLIDCATVPKADMVVTAFVGMIGIRPTIEAIKAGKDIALANKETLVTAGHIIMPLAKEKNVKILPVDSEHSAIFQCLQGAGDNRPAAQEKVNMNTLQAQEEAPAPEDPAEGDTKSAREEDPAKKEQPNGEEDPDKEKQSDKEARDDGSAESQAKRVRGWSCHCHTPIADIRWTRSRFPPRTGSCISAR